LGLSGINRKNKKIIEGVTDRIDDLNYREKEL
jgi:chromosome segregation ATPase